MAKDAWGRVVCAARSRGGEEGRVGWSCRQSITCFWCGGGGLTHVHLPCTVPTLEPCFFKQCPYSSVELLIPISSWSYGRSRVPRTMFLQIVPMPIHLGRAANTSFIKSYHYLTIISNPSISHHHRSISYPTPPPHLIMPYIK